MSELKILFHDEHFVAIDKPAGLLVHRSWIAKDAKVFAMQQLRDQLGQHVYPVHRLDRPTSGILLFALDSDSARKMSEAFATRRVSKMYHAVVRGFVAEHGQVDYALREELDKIADRQAEQDKAAQEAVTDYMSLARVELPYPVSTKHQTTRYSLLRLSPKTGRKHQLRRHMAHIRHPIVGDTNHGDGRHNRFFREHFGIQRLLLAATGLEFSHPCSGQDVNIRCPLPEEFRRPFQAPDAIRVEGPLP